MQPGETAVFPLQSVEPWLATVTTVIQSEPRLSAREALIEIRKLTSATQRRPWTTLSEIDQLVRRGLLG